VLCDVLYVVVGVKMARLSAVLLTVGLLCIVISAVDCHVLNRRFSPLSAYLNKRAPEVRCSSVSFHSTTTSNCLHLPERIVGQVSRKSTRCANLFSAFYHPQMRRGNAFGHVCLSVRLTVLFVVFVL